LPFLDAIYRGEGYLSDAALFGRSSPPTPPLVEQIAATIAALPEVALSALPTVYVPLAIGDHVDHQLVYRAGNSWPRGAGARSPTKTSPMRSSVARPLAAARP
jgi:hypothetical protein